MSAVVVFIIFVVCLVIAIPVSIALGIASVLPGAFDPSFTASGQFVIRSMLGCLDSFPLLAVPMFVLSGILMARGGISRKLFDVFAYFFGKRSGRHALCGDCHLSFLWCNFRFGTGNSGSCGQHDHSDSGESWL